MKYIPLESFEAINSLLQAVDAQGCLVTLRLEAYTCRHTREERQIATNLAQYRSQVQSTPPLSPSPGIHGAFDAPPPMVLGSSVVDAPGSSVPVAVEDIDQRLVFLVAALNSMYAEDGYDFSVLTERDFVVHDPATVRCEIDLTLQSLPESCAPAVHRFWPAIHEQVLDATQGCEVYEFCCPSCDPRGQTSIFSHHYFFYHRPRKVLVTLLLYGEGNRYRGDDGYMPPGDRDEMLSSPCSTSTPEPADEYRGEQKNRHFYGY